MNEMYACLPKIKVSSIAIQVVTRQRMHWHLSQALHMVWRRLIAKGYRSPCLKLNAN
jgi:hypothetical protein